MTMPDLQTWPRTLLTLAEWDAMPVSEGRRVECTEGVLIVVPSPAGRHQKVMARLSAVLDAQLPPDMVSVPDVDVLLAGTPLTVRAPDVIVTRTSVLDANPSRYDARDVRLVVEVVSPGSRRTDRVTKASEYADAGIGAYWILDGDPLTLTALVLDGGLYRHLGDFSGVADLEVAGTRVRVDLDALTRR